MALRAAVFAFGLTLSALVYAGPLGVRPDGTVIVVPNAPHERESAAARLLQEWLRKACRAETGFEILAEDKLGDAQGRAVLALGRTKWAPAEAAKLYRDGFIIRREGERVVIAGGEPAGTFFGAAHFLDKFCGVRFYMPGDLFTSLPEKPEVTLPDAVDITEEPFVKNCTMTGVANVPAVEGPWLQRSTAHRKESFSHQHSMFQRFPPEQFAQRFPEIYPILKGQRYIPQAANDQRWQPCLSEPKLLDAAEESAIAYFQKTPEVNFISFSVQDSHEFCQCPRCQAEVDKHRVADAKFGDVTAYSLMNATFINRLAERLEKKLPDKTIVYIAYAKVRRPPPFKLHRNVMPVLVFTIADTIIDRVLEPGGNIPLDRWAEVSRRFGHHDWGEGMGYLIPRSYIGLTAQVARFVKQKGLTWGYAHFEAYPNWGLDGPKLYLTPKIWWNPDVDVDPLWRQFCADMFPQAQAPMREYFDTLEKLWIEMDNQHERKMTQWGKQFILGTPEQQRLARQARELLDRASALAAQGPETQRVALFSKTYRLTEYFFAFANAAEIERAKVDECRKYAEEVIAPDPMTVFRGYDKARVMATVEQALKAVTAGKTTK